MLKFSIHAAHLCLKLTWDNSGAGRRVSASMNALPATKSLDLAPEEASRVCL